MILVAAFALWASAIDAKRRRLPNKLLAPMFITAAACQLLRWLGPPWLALLPWLHALDRMLPTPTTCCFLAFGIGAMLYGAEWIHRRLHHVPGLGGGDIKLATCWTLALGNWALLSLALACITGALWAQAHHESTFPLGPFITVWCLAASLFLSFF